MIELASLAESSSATTQQVAASTQQTAATAGQLTRVGAAAGRRRRALERCSVVQFTVTRSSTARARVGDVLAREAEVLVERARGRGGAEAAPSPRRRRGRRPSGASPSGAAASTATRARTDGGSTLSRYAWSWAGEAVQAGHARRAAP